MEKKLLPLYMDLRSRPVVIFGGGRVAQRKAALFSQHAPVTVVSKDFTATLEDMAEAGQIKLVYADLSQGCDVDCYLNGAFMAIPATSNPEVNRSIEEQASMHGMLVNRVDGIGDVVVPSIIRRGPVTIAISSMGTSPALSKYIRIKLERDLTEDYSEMARLLGEMRQYLKRTVPQQRTRADILWEILSDQEVWHLLHESYEKAYMRAREHAPQDERDSLDAGNPPQGLHR